MGPYQIPEIVCYACAGKQTNKQTNNVLLFWQTMFNGVVVNHYLVAIMAIW